MASERTKEFFRLLSEAEWEYACRAGTTTRYWWGDDIQANNANWAGSVNNKTTEVGSYKPNPLGLYDMHGNVREWVEDAFHESYEGAPSDGSAWTNSDEKEPRRVMRGDAWDYGFADRSSGLP